MSEAWDGLLTIPKICGVLSTHLPSTSSNLEQFLLDYVNTHVAMIKIFSLAN